jgi:hypothetical protein
MSHVSDRRARTVGDGKAGSKDLTGHGAGTLVMTLEGEIPVEHLSVGDRVITRSGARTLKAVAARLVKGAFVIAPHTLGHDRPEAEVAVGPTQKLLLRDWRARALYDRDQAQVPVARLVDGEYISAAAGPVRLWRLGFDREEVIYAGGLELTVPAPDPALA